MATKNIQCAGCEKTLDDGRLYKCPICFKYFCHECATNRGGRLFCSKYCADFFFFGDGDND